MDGGDHAPGAVGVRLHLRGVPRLLCRGIEGDSDQVAARRPAAGDDPEGRREISHVQLARGVQRLYLNISYALSDEAGELHLPEDNNRIEIAYSESDLSEIRAQVATDAALLGEKGLPLSAEWWRQVGNEEKALMAEALVQNFSANPPALAGKRRQAMNRYNVQVVLKVNSTGNWALVQWEGYHPSWEAWRIHGDLGTPLQTWEPVSHVRRTVAWCTFRS